MSTMIYSADVRPISVNQLDVKFQQSACLDNPVILLGTKAAGLSRNHCTTTTTCVYLDRQIALPIWGATHVFIFFIFFFYICISFSIFVILVDVFFRFFGVVFKYVICGYFS